MKDRREGNEGGTKERVNLDASGMQEQDRRWKQVHVGAGRREQGGERMLNPFQYF
jgi:hypothetical protein